MRFQTRKNTVIDLLFPIALFFVFAVSALTVVLLAANVYQSTTTSASYNYTTRTSLSYISEKIHQNDINGGISIGSFDGCESLILKQNYNKESYITYIYVYDGNLRELFIKDGINATKMDGKIIIAIKSFQMKALNDNLFQFTATNQDNQTASIIVSPTTSK